MIVYEYTMKGNDKPIHYLTPFENMAETDCDDWIIIWEAEVAPIEFQNDESKEKTKECKNAGYSYCQSIGWVKLINQINKINLKNGKG